MNVRLLVSYIALKEEVDLLPIIHVQIVDGRSEEDIKSLVGALTNATSENLNVPKERVRVLVQEVPETHWAVGGKVMKDLKAEGKR